MQHDLHLCIAVVLPVQLHGDGSLQVDQGFLSLHVPLVFNSRSRIKLELYGLATHPFDAQI